MSVGSRVAGAALAAARRERLAVKTGGGAFGGRIAELFLALGYIA